MKTRAEMIDDARGLVFDSEEQLIAIVATQPEREATARLILADAVRAHTLLSSRASFERIGWEVAARLQRCTLLTQALQRPVQ